MRMIQKHNNKIFRNHRISFIYSYFWRFSKIVCKKTKAPKTEKR